MKSDLILKLADVMEKRPTGGYVQGAWLDYGGDHYLNVTSEVAEFKPVFKTKTAKNDPHVITIKEGACGSAMCVLGTAAVDMQEETGLTFIASLLEEDYEKPNVTVAYGIEPALLKGGTLLRNWDAGAEAFGIPYDHSRVLFGSDNDTPTIMFYCGVNMERARQIRDDDTFHDYVNTITVAERLREYVASDGYIDPEILEMVSE